MYEDVRELVRDSAGDAAWMTSPNYVRVSTVEAIVEEVEQRDGELDGMSIYADTGRRTDGLISVRTYPILELSGI